jgi:hypothetical protein
MMHKCVQVMAVVHGEERAPEELLALAAKQRMNTDTRRAIFCIVSFLSFDLS